MGENPDQGRMTRAKQRRFLCARLAFSRDIFEASACGAPQRASTRALAQFEAWAERVQRVGEPASTGGARREAAAEVQRQGGEGVGRRNASPPRSQSQPPSAPLSLDQTSAPSSQLPKLFCLTAPSTSFPEFPRPFLLPMAPPKTQPVVGPASIPPSLPPSPPPSPPAGERSPAPATLGSMGPIWIMAGYGSLSIRMVRHWAQILSRHGARVHARYWPGKTRVVIVPKGLAPGILTQLLSPCGDDVTCLHQAWMEEAVRRCLSLGGRKRGREEGRAGTVDLALPPLNPYYYHVNALPRPERKMNVAAGKVKRRGRQTTEEAEKEEEGGEGESGLGGRHRQSETAKWTCREASRAGLLNHNVHLTVFLDELIAIYDMLGSDIAGGRYRRAQYHRFVQILRGLPFAINKDNLRSLKKKRGIGSSMLKDIGEILEYGRLSRLEALKRREGVEACLSFQKVWGVGPATARALFTHDKIQSISELRARVRSHPGILNENQRVGLRYYEEFQERIPRSEVRKIEERVREATEALYPGVFMLTTCGSYRRGASHCGDVDILLAPVSERVQARGFLGRLILHLEKEGFLTDHLTDATDDKSDSYFGVCRLGDGYLHRRLDLKVYSRQQYPFAVLYFTGSDHFNRSMRCWAIKHKGWSLTDKSMGPAVWERGKKVADIGPRIVCTEEREIFHRLGLAYKRPWERNTHDAVSLEALKKEHDEAGDSDREETGDRGNKKEAWALSPSEME